VIVDVPTASPLTMPLETPIVATDVAPLDHVPLTKSL
jgi:hypothetical protein